MAGTSKQAGEDVNELLAKLAENGVADTLENPDIKPFFLDALQEAGLSKIQSRIAFTLLRGLAIRSINFAADAAGSRLEALVQRLPFIPKLIDAVTAIDLKARDTSVLSQAFKARLSDSEFETSATANLELLQASYLLKSSGEMADLLDEIQDDIQSLTQGMERFNQAFQNFTEPPLSWPPIAAGATLSAADNLKYNSGRYALVGREEELDLLGQFLGDLSLQGDKHRFRWLLMTGLGGEGKSRLAFDFTQQLEKEGVWHAGRLAIADLKQFNANHWNPVRPTLIVIDYPIAAPTEVGALLSALARNAKDFYFPVRVLLLERDTGEWFKQAVPETADGLAVRSHSAVQNSGGESADQLSYPLLPLGRNEIIALMRNRLSKSEFSNEFSDDDLFDLACRVDNRQHPVTQQASPRALFAIAAAEVLVTGKQNHSEKSSEQLLREQTRDKVLNSIIERDRQTRWRPASNNNEASLRIHENLLALATACGGMTLDQLDDAPEESGEFLPDPAPASRHDLELLILQAMTGLVDSKKIPPLEPDILGEYFVLKTHERLMPARRKQSFVNTAFHQNPHGAAIFTLRALTDFSKEMESAGLFAPDRSAGPEAAGGFGLVAIGITARETTNTSAELIDQVMDRLDALRCELPRHEKIALREAQAAVNITRHAEAAGDWTRIEQALARIDTLRREFPGHDEIVLMEAKAAVNIISHARAAGEWTRIEQALARIDALRREFPGHEEIALEEAKTTVNITRHAEAAGDWTRIEQALARIDTLRREFPGHEEIALMEAVVAVNIIGHAGAAGDWSRVEQALRRIDVLLGDLHQRYGIGLEAAMATFNVISHAGALGDWARVEQMSKRASELSSAFPQGTTILCMTKAVMLARFYFRCSRGNEVTQDETREAARLALQRIQCSLKEGSEFLINHSLQIMKTAIAELPADSQVLEVKEELESMGADFDQIPEIPRVED